MTTPNEEKKELVLAEIRKRYVNEEEAEKVAPMAFIPISRYVKIMKRLENKVNEILSYKD